MTRRRPKDSAQTAPHSSNVLRVPERPGQTPEKARAAIAASAVIRGAVTGRKFAESIFGADVDLTAYAGELQRQADAATKCDLSALEAMLMTQANTLDMMFNHLARKAAHSEYLKQMEAHLRHALKAQAQCRATLEALNEIKNPRPLAFVNQANFANGPQQVNNGTAPPTSRAHMESDTSSNEALENRHGEWLDTRTASATGPSNQTVEAMGKIGRADV